MHYICIKTNSYLQPILKFAPLKVPESPMETYKRFFLVFWFMHKKPLVKVTKNNQTASINIKY